jgi:hypothetical protein
VHLNKALLSLFRKLVSLLCGFITIDNFCFKFLFDSCKDDTNFASNLTDSRVVRENPNPNPNFRVPELSGSSFFRQISGSNFENPKFLKTELLNPKFSGYLNAHP